MIDWFQRIDTLEEGGDRTSAGRNDDSSNPLLLDRSSIRMPAVQMNGIKGLLGACTHRDRAAHIRGR